MLHNIRKHKRIIRTLAGVFFILFWMGNISREHVEAVFQMETDQTAGPVETVQPQMTSTPAHTVDPGTCATPKPVATTGVSATPKPTAAPKPVKLRIKQQKGKMKVTWKKVSGAVTYQIYVKKAGQRFKKVKTTKKKTAWIKYAPGKKYQIKVLAYAKKNKKISASESYQFFVPKKTKRINILYQSAKEAELSWNKVAGADYYLVYRKSGKGSYRQMKKTKRCSFKDRKLTSGVQYKYKIQAMHKEKQILCAGQTTVRSYDNRKIVSIDHQKYTYDEMAQDIMQLSQRYPGIVHYNVIGKSEDGRNLYDVVIGNQNASKSVLVISTLHAREYMASLLCMNQIEYYARCYHEEIDGKKISSVFQQVCVHYIPMANPDGVTISQYGVQKIRNKKIQKKLKKMSKGVNTTLWKANAKGVDLNDNFPYHFQVKGTVGSQGYSGRKAANAKETKAIIKRINALKRHNLKAVINYHAMGSIVFGDHSGLSGSVAANTNKMYETARKVTGYASAAGYSGGTSDSSGNLREYIMYQKHLPSITLEIGRRVCPGPISEFPAIWKANANLVLREAMLF